MEAKTILIDHLTSIKFHLKNTTMDLCLNRENDDRLMTNERCQMINGKFLFLLEC